MSRVSSDDQFHFLISCIRHSNNGKVDFGKVAEECEIVTRGAAAKRYERMMKAHGINNNDGDTSSTATPSPAKTHTAGSNNKRKTATGNGNNGNGNGNAVNNADDDPGSPTPPNKKKRIAKGQKIRERALESAEKIASAPATSSAPGSASGSSAGSSVSMARTNGKEKKNNEKANAKAKSNSTSKGTTMMRAHNDGVLLGAGEVVLDSIENSEGTLLKKEKELDGGLEWIKEEGWGCEDDGDPDETQDDKLFFSFVRRDRVY